MFKALVLPAAALAAMISLASPERAEARAPRHRTAPKTAASTRRKPATPARAHAGKSRKKPETRRAARHGRVRASHPGKAPKRIIRQNDRGEVVIDRVELIGLPPAPPAPVAADAAQIAGPSRELQNYPPAPCEATDVVIEAHVHEMGPADADGATAELREEPGDGDDAEGPPAEAPRSATRARLSRIASRVGSFFRPKSGESEVRPQDVDLTELVSKSFLIPVEGVDAEKLRDSFLSSRGRHAQHLAIDIGAPKGTPILATTDGEIVRMSKERRGGNAIYQKDATGRYLLFYCHLSRYADDLAAGRKVRKGDVIGYVGSTGHVIGGPHLHFSITRVPDDGDSFRKGLAINPYLLFLVGVP